MEKAPAVAAPLPVEVIQSILQHLDVESYHAARSTCRGWRYAASAPCMLSAVLYQTPMLLPPKTTALTGAEWNRYFDQVARLNLLSYRTNVRKTISKLASPSGYKTSNVQASSSNGHTTVDLEGAQLRVSCNQASWEFPVAQSLYPARGSICHQSMNIATSSYTPRNERYTKYCLAISSRSDILAVALGKKIHIYSLYRDDDDDDGDGGNNNNNERRASPVEYTLNQTDRVFRFVPRAGFFEDTDGVVKSLEFTDDDTLLRVCIHHETTSYRPSRVRYLGNPGHELDGNPGLSYWRASLNHIYLDTVALALELVGHDAGRCLLRSLRLLPLSFQIHSQHRHHHNDHRDHTRKISHTDTPPTRYFITALQTRLVDGYAIGSILTESHPTGKVQIHRVIPSRYHAPRFLHREINSSSTTNNNNIITGVYPFTNLTYHPAPQTTNDTNTPTDPLPHYSVPLHQPFVIPRPIPSTSTPTPTPTRADTDPAPGTTSKNLRLALPRWLPANLPSATFSSPLLATSPDNRLAVIYEPGGSHTRFAYRGGSLYVVDISSCTPAYQPYAGHRTAAAAAAAAAGSPTNMTAAWLKARDAEGPQDIIPAWPFLLDQVYVDVNAVGIKMSSCPPPFPSSSSSSSSSPSSSPPPSFSPSSPSSSPTPSTPTTSTNPPIKPATQYTVWATSEEKGLNLQWELGVNIFF